MATTIVPCAGGAGAGRPQKDVAASASAAAARTLKSRVHIEARQSSRAAVIAGVSAATPKVLGVPEPEELGGVPQF